MLILQSTRIWPGVVRLRVDVSEAPQLQCFV